jgi:hypothetical protein
MNKDGYPDLIMTSYTGGETESVYVHLNDREAGPGDERFPLALSCSQETHRHVPGVQTGAEPYCAGVGDLTGDSYPDVAVVNHGVGLNRPGFSGDPVM